MITLDVSSLLTYIGGIGVIGVTIWAGIKYLSKSYVDQYFKEELEAYKHDLQQLLELKNMNYSKFLKLTSLIFKGKCLILISLLQKSIQSMLSYTGYT